MTSLKTLAAAALLSALAATPAFAQAAIPEPDLFASYHSKLDVLRRLESRNIGQTLTDSPGLTTRIVHHDVDCRSCKQKPDAWRHRTFGQCIASHSAAPGWKGKNTRNDDWPADMILG
jgi:hypothetical protein